MRRDNTRRGIVLKGAGAVLALRTEPIGGLAGRVARQSKRLHRLGLANGSVVVRIIAGKGAGWGRRNDTR